MKAQQGIALISVLLIMALALLLTASLLRNHRLLLHSSGQQIQYLELRQWALAGEHWARQQLPLGLFVPVNLSQPWATARVPFVPPGGTLAVEIEDLAGRYNLNAAIASGLRLPGLELPKQPLSRGLSGLSEWSGLEPSVAQAWQSRLALLPTHAGLNLNTASQAALQLHGLPPATAATLLAQRPVEGYRSVQAFLAEPLAQGLGLTAQGLSLSSLWFQVRVRVVLGQRQLLLASDFELDRKTRQARLVQRRLWPGEALP